MPRARPSPTMPSFRQTLHRPNRVLNFQRPVDRHDPSPHSTPSNIKSSRSFPNLHRSVFDRKFFSSTPPHHTSHTPRPPPDPCADDDDLTLPTPHPPLCHSTSASQKHTRKSSPSKSRMARTTSFGDPTSRVWASSSALFLSPRSNTDDVLWSRLKPLRIDKLRKKRYSSYTCTSDFELSEADNLVDIDLTMLCRLPDRDYPGAADDIFGRRRRDLAATSNDVLCHSHSTPIVDCDDTVVVDSHALHNSRIHACVDTRDDYFHQHVQLGHPAPQQEDEEQEDTINTIANAIDSSKGKLRKSANMSRAFKAVIKSGEGWVRKSDVVQATLDSEDRRDPSMIILLDPTSYDAANPHTEPVSTPSEETSSADTVSSKHNASAASLGFSTSMTAKQCAATLETLLREMSCKVSRYPDTDHASRQLIRLRVVRNVHGARRMDRKTKIIVTVREEDHIRTSVSFKRLAGLYSSRDSYIPLCTDIRERFQREWPAVVEALYIRLPNNSTSPKR